VGRLCIPFDKEEGIGEKGIEERKEGVSSSESSYKRFSLVYQSVKFNTCMLVIPQVLLFVFSG